LIIGFKEGLMNLALRIAILQTVRTQTRLASVTGIAEWRLSKIVNGWQSATPDERRRIADALGCKPEEIFSDVGQSAELAAGAA
jgi:plasmid maintenance system antidote protein VapI